MNRADRVLVTLAVGSVGASTVHGWAHLTIPVETPASVLVPVAVLLFLAPVAGVALLATDHRPTGAWTLLLAGLLGFVMEATLHFAVRNADHVATVERGHVLFANTALLSTAGDALLAVGAGWVIWRQAQGSSSSSSIASIR